MCHVERNGGSYILRIFKRKFAYVQPNIAPKWYGVILRDDRTEGKSIAIFNGSIIIGSLIFLLFVL